MDAISERMLQDLGDDLQVDEIPASMKFKTVLGDIFHFMDRAKLPMRHEFKALFLERFVLLYLLCIKQM